MTYRNYVNNYAIIADAKLKCALPCTCSTCMYGMWAALVTNDYPAEAEMEMRCAITVNRGGERKGTMKNKYGYEFDFDAARSLMDDELCEEINASGEAETDQDFFNVYCKRHEEKFGEEFELAKENPCW